MAGGYISLVVRCNGYVPADVMKIAWCCSSKALVMASKARLGRPGVRVRQTTEIRRSSKGRRRRAEKRCDRH